MNCIIRILAVFTRILITFNVLHEVSARSKLGGPIYSIYRPDSIYHDSSAQFSITIENVSDNIINLQTDSILVEVIIRGVVGRGFDQHDYKFKQKVIVDDKVLPNEIAPNQVVCKKFKMDSLLFPEVTTIPPPQNDLSNCETKKELHRNFFEFVNEYRIEEFKKIVNEPGNENFSIFSVALDAGFNSKPTFNRIFKEKTGQTPSEFRGTAGKE
jgi:hypothetical protein